jgi:myo-inositol 2-dehydrogenase / D-chiro-inositol 1-dehydrogenase
MGKITFCIVGLGRAGNFHLTSIKSLKNAELLSVVDANAELVKQYGDSEQCNAYLTIDEALADPKLDAVVIASPTDSHFEYIIKSLTAGKHVFTEKPLGHALHEVEECFDLAAAKGLALHLGFQRRFDKSFVALKEALPQLGNLRLWKASSRDNPRPSIAYLSISGNIFHDMLIHDFDMLTFLLGAAIPEKVFAAGYAHDKEIANLNDFDTVMCTVQYPDGLICSIDTSRISAYGYDQRLEVFGANGMVRAENQLNNTLQVSTAAGTNLSPANHSFPQRYKEAYTEIIRQFIAGIENGVLNNVSKQECMLSHLIADAALEAAMQNKVIDFDAQYGDKIRKA